MRSSGRKNRAIWLPKKQLWRIKIQREGAVHYFYSDKQNKPTTRGQLQAERKADEWLLHRTNSSDIILDLGFKKFMAHLKFRAQSRHSSSGNILTHESRYRNHIQPVLGYKKLSKITDRDWQKIINKAAHKGAIRDAGLSKRSLENIASTINQMYRYLIEKEKLDLRMPGELIIPYDAPVKEKGIIQPSELRILFSDDTSTFNGQVINDPYVHAYRFLVTTGLRRGELAGLENKDVADDMIVVRRAINNLKEETLGKTQNAQRTMMQNDLIKKILSDQKHLLNEMGIISKYVFPSLDGCQLDPNSLYRYWKRYRKHHGIKSDIQGMRRTHVSINEKSLPDITLKRIVGHSDKMDTHGVYGRIVDGDLDDAAAIINQNFMEIVPEFIKNGVPNGV